MTRKKRDNPFKFPGKDSGFSNASGGGGNAGHDAPGGHGGWGATFRRLVDTPENPIGWSFFMCRAFGINVRLHLFTLVYLILLPLSALARDNLGIMLVLPLIIALFVVVLLHEFGHCFACRWVGGEADRIVLLPWGGLALCAPPHDWRSNLITTVGGPAVNLALFPLTAALLWAAGLQSWIIFNPLQAWGPLADGSLTASSTPIAYLKAAAWWFHYTNFIIFAFNMLLVMFPFDAGRIVHALIWRRAGYQRAAEVSANVGLVGAIVLGAFALVLSQFTLLCIAIFGGLTCFAERKRARGAFEIPTGGLGIGNEATNNNPYQAAYHPPDDDPAPSRRDLKRQAEAERLQQEVDRILAKIADEGMGALTAKERAALKKATKHGQQTK